MKTLHQDIVGKKKVLQGSRRIWGFPLCGIARNVAVYIEEAYPPLDVFFFLSSLLHATFVY